MSGYITTVLYLYISSLYIMDVRGYNISNYVKRDLNWVDNNIESSDDGNPSIKVRYFKPNKDNPRLNDNGNYIAFMLYQPGSNIGEFYFVDSDIAGSKREHCKNFRPTMHAGAYYHFFGKCPEQEVNKLVASGFCYQGKNGRGLVFNSLTFNSGKTMFASYLDSQYYKSDTRSMNTDEQILVRQCFEKWRETGYRIDHWKCDLTETEGRRRRSIIPICSDCTCDTATSVSGVNSVFPPCAMVMITSILVSKVLT